MMIFPDVVLDYICDQVDPAVKYTKYNYDKQNRITKISSYNKSETLVCTETFTYRDNNLIKVVYEEICTPTNRTEEYTIEGKRITYTVKGGYLDYLGTRTGTIELNNDELPIKIGSSNQDVSYSSIYQYQDGNLLKIISSGEQNYSYTFEYDNNKSPFYHCQTPKWYIFYDSYWFGSNNNLMQEIVITTDDNNVYSETVYKYEYDSYGFPTKRILNVNGNEYVLEFRYK
jgi:effector-binding domain-containing protein